MTIRIGRSRYKQFYSGRSDYVRKSESWKTFVRAQWGAFEGTFVCEVEATNSTTHFKEYRKVLP